MELFLVRHGETVDNVAGLYAGVRDSALTNHGVEQARRLGEHFAKTGIIFTDIFSSPLTRAFKTAEAIRTVQPSDGQPSVTQVADLMEQDFGSLEGKPFQARSDPKKSGRETYQERHRNQAGFVEVETKQSMDKRAKSFLDDHLIPLFRSARTEEKLVVAVVSHGMLLSHLWRSLLQRLPAKSVTVDPEVAVARGSVVLQHLGGWSNTGYLQLLFTVDAKVKPTSVTDLVPASEDHSEDHDPEEDRVVGPSESERRSCTNPSRLDGWSTLICGIDRKDHLIGLKRQRGGIGRAAHDEDQKKLDGFFFKRQRTS